jgi:5'-3' exonuclease
MGIELFFKSISENKIIGSESITSQTLQKKISVNNLYIDFNSIVHIMSSKILSHINTIIKSLINNTKNADIEILTKMYHINLKNFDSPIKLRAYVLPKLDGYIMDAVLDYIVNMVTNYIVPEELQVLYLGVDGVPMKTKMIEQKKRRYMGTLYYYLRRKLFAKHFPEIKKHPNIYAYEETKVDWNKSLITPGTYFFRTLITRLKDTNYEQKLKSIAINLQEYTVSDLTEYGEGEKKIVNKIFFSIKPKSKLKILIYSPDSDMTLLALLLSDSRQIEILRHNQQKQDYDIINISKLREQLIEYMEHKLETKNNNLKNELIEDIVFVFTIFGNDFVPKIESINVKYNFEYVIDKYIEYYKNENTFLIETKNETKKINEKAFINFLKLLQLDELNLLQKNYMQSTYRNFNKVVQVFDPENKLTFHELKINVNDFIKLFNKFRKTFIDSSSKTIDPEILKDDNFWVTFNKLALWKGVFDNKITDKDKIINATTNFFRQNHKLPKVNIYLQKFSHDLEDQHHMRQFTERHNSKEVLDYDKEVYQLDNLLNPYYTSLKIFPVPIGYVDVKKNLYWEPSPIDQTKYINEYHKTHFEEPLNKVVNEYVTGLVWVFDYYYHYNDTITSMSNWHYPYTKAPLLMDIVEHIEHNFFNKKQNIIKAFDIPLQKYYNPTDHLIFVTPLVVNNIYLLPKSYVLENRNQVYKVTHYFDDLAERIVSGRDVGHEMDCRGANFLTKCAMNVP